MLRYLSTFIVLVSPCLSYLMDNSSQIVHAGTDLKLECNLGIVNSQDEDILWTSSPKKAEIKYGGRIRIIKNLTFEDSGKYECQNNVEKAWKTITVGKAPDQASRFSCTTHYSLKHMKCCWNVGNATGIPTTYSLHYITRTRHLWINLDYSNEELAPKIAGSCVPKQNDLPRMTQRCCDIPLPDVSDNISEIKLESIIQLKSENALDVVTSHNFTENPFAWVKPPPPFNLTSEVKKETYVYIMNVAWESPNMTLKVFEYRIRYRLTIKRTYREWQVLKGITENYYTIAIHRSHSLVEVQVSARPSGRFGGDWSDWSISAFNSTGVIPPTSTLRFQKVVSDVSDGVFTITTHWIEYGRLDEPGFHYKMLYENCNGDLIASINVTKNLTIWKKKLNVTDCIKITGLYCNVMGCSDNTSIKVLPSKAPKYNAEIRMEVLKSGFQMKWNFEELVKPNTTCVVKIFEIHRTQRDNTTFTVQTLLSEENVFCTEEIFTFSGSPSICKEYYSTLGIVHISDEVTYTTTFKSKFEILEFASVPKIGISEIYSNTPNKINVTWHTEEKNCSHLLPRILYKPVNGAECYPDKVTCKEEFVSKAFDCNVESGTVTNNVYGDTTYQVHMAFCCPSEIYYNRNKPICYNNEGNDVNTVRTIVTVSEAPTNYFWNGDNSTLYWDPPNHKNGPITGYIVSISESSDVTTFRNVATVHRNITFDKICVKNTQETTLQIMAFNAKDGEGETLYGEHGPKISIDCSARKAIHQNSVPVIVGSIVGIFAVIVCATLTYYYKRRVKNILVRALWPPVPQPALTVAFQVHDEEIDLENAEIDMQNIRTNRDEEYYDEIEHPLLSNFRSESEVHVMEHGVKNIRQRQLESTNNDRGDQSTENGDNIDINDTENSNREIFNEKGNSLDDITISHQERRHSCGATSSDDINKPGDSSYIKTAGSPFSSRNSSQQYNSSSRYSSNSYYGSTPSLPSYLTCSTAYPFSLHTSPERSELGSIYARMPDLYKWTMPDYTTFLTDNQSSSWNDLPQTSSYSDWKTSTPRVILGERDENKIFTSPPLPSYTCFATKN